MSEPVSFWMRQVERPVRPPLDGDRDVDVCVIGAGYTGLWTAYYLALADPGLRVAVIEAEHVGFGASGRNGGWASAKLAGLERMLGNPRTLQAGKALQSAMYVSLDEMAAAVADEEIECGFHMGGTVLAATHPSHVSRLRRSVQIKHDAGFGEQHLRWLEPSEARQMIRTAHLYGASFTPHCASLDPARLSLGLAAAIERRGVEVFERTRGVVDGRRVVTPGGVITAEAIVVATEAYGVQGGRSAIPVYSLMVMTEPIGRAAWDAIGLDDRPTFSDGRHMIIYGQRTDDDRIAFGGRGAPYHFGSRIEPGFDHDEATFEYIRTTLRELFPALADVGFVDSWGGPLAIPRDWRPSISYDPATGVARAGGYVGQGVAAAHLAGQTVADLIVGSDTDRVHLDWVGHRSRKWEPEPFRWVGVNLGRMMTESIDHSEQRGRHPRVRQAILDRLPIG